MAGSPVAMYVIAGHSRRCVVRKQYKCLKGNSGGSWLFALHAGDLADQNVVHFIHLFFEQISSQPPSQEQGHGAVLQADS